MAEMGGSKAKDYHHMSAKPLQGALRLGLVTTCLLKARGRPLFGWNLVKVDDGDHPWVGPLTVVNR